MIGQIALFNKKTPEDSATRTSGCWPSSPPVGPGDRERPAAGGGGGAGRMQEDLRLAYEIQVNLLPTESPALPGYELVGKSLPAKKWAATSTSSAGNGPAGVFHRRHLGEGDAGGAAHVQRAGHRPDQTLLHATPAECVQRANTQIYHCTRPGKFASMFYAQLQRDAHHLRYVNAGHNYPLITRAGEVRRLEEGGVVLGVMESFRSRRRRCRWRRGPAAALLERDHRSRQRQARGVRRGAHGARHRRLPPQAGGAAHPAGGHRRPGPRLASAPSPTT